MKKFKLFKRKTSRHVARERLKQLLMNDRLNLSVDMTEKIQKDIFKCISKYLEIDEQKMHVQFQKDNKTDLAYITATIPVKSITKKR